jgi:hypothetical protein
MGVFSMHQPVYAERGIATFPLTDSKRPAIRNYQKIGLRSSARFAARFTDSDSFGFMTNSRSRVSVLDVDTNDERVLVDAIGRHGPTPLIGRTASGKYHALYRHNGEFRKIRPFGDLPIDLLGIGGLAVAVPSRVVKGEYSFIQGSLDDIDRLPVMRGLDPAMYRPRDTSTVHAAPTGKGAADHEMAAAPEGIRNIALWRFCMQQLAITSADIDAIVAAAIARNSSFTPPLPESEVIATAASAWGYTAQGRNWFGQRGSYLPAAKVEDMVSDPYFLALINWLQAKNAPSATFWVADGLATALGWPERQLARVRKKAVAAGWIVPITAKAPRRPITYRWGKAAARRGAPTQAGGEQSGVFVEDMVSNPAGVEPAIVPPQMRVGRR